MGAVRCFFWDPPTTGSRRNPFLNRGGWRIGNAGDLLNKVLIEATYGVGALNLSDGTGRRLLLIGSVAHRIEGGDLVFGVGSKGLPPPGPDVAPCRIVGTRGPITTQALADAGHDMANLEFELDPGLLIPRLLPVVPAPVKGRVIFIPHYRQATRRRPRRDIRVVSIDADPVALAKTIAEAELVYTSSLHGLVFAHALGRPVRLVTPPAAENELKYQDYIASIGQPWRKPVSIDEAVRESTPDSPVTLPNSLSNLRLPTWSELCDAGVAS